MSVSEAEIDPLERTSARPKRRPRSAVTSGRKLFVEGDSNSAWSRRYYDLCSHHINDISRGLGRNVLSEAQLSLIRRAAAIECEIERLDALLSLGEAVNLNEYGRATSHLRRLFEVLKEFGFAALGRKLIRCWPKKSAVRIGRPGPGENARHCIPRIRSYQAALRSTSATLSTR